MTDAEIKKIVKALLDEPIAQTGTKAGSTTTLRKMIARSEHYMAAMAGPLGRVEVLEKWAEVTNRKIEQLATDAERRGNATLDAITQATRQIINS